MFLFVPISLTWLGIGIVMIVAPSFWERSIARSFIEPVKGFVLSEGVLLIGLLLVTGSGGLRGRWLWTAIGGLMAIKALLLLGFTDKKRQSLFAQWERVPPITHRLAGVMLVALATLLAIDTIGNLR